MILTHILMRYFNYPEFKRNSYIDLEYHEDVIWEVNESEYSEKNQREVNESEYSEKNQI